MTPVELSCKREFARWLSMAVEMSPLGTLFEVHSVVGPA